MFEADLTVRNFASRIFYLHCGRLVVGCRDTEEDLEDYNTRMPDLCESYS
jgi:hypothetical protein